MNHPYEAPQAELIYLAVSDLVMNSPDDDYKDDIDWE